MALPTSTQQTPQAGGSSSVNTPVPSLEEYTKVRSKSSNDCDWLHELVSSDAISSGKVNPNYLVRVCYKETEDASITLTKDFGIGLFEDLERHLASKFVRAVISCHRDSSQVDPEILNILWSKFNLEVSFMRQHFDYKEFRYERGCPERIRNNLEEEKSEIEDFWTFGGRWNPIRLPSETYASMLRLFVSSECLSFCFRGGTVIALIRSKAGYWFPQSVAAWEAGHPRLSIPSSIDFFAANLDGVSVGHGFPSDPSEFSHSIVHFYARLLVLRCYEDYNLRHSTQPIRMHTYYGRASSHAHVVEVYHRGLELLTLKQGLSAFLGPLTPEHGADTVSESSDSFDNPYRRMLQGVLNDLEMLLALHYNAERIYERSVHGGDFLHKTELASEQLEEVKESKATAVKVGKLSNLAFLYLPVNFVCTMLGMNLAIYGQGEVPVWVFLALVILFSILTYLPIFLPLMGEQKVRLYRVAYHLTRRSVPAGFWFCTFSLTHTYRQSFEIMDSSLTQELLGYPGVRTKGWMFGGNDTFFEKSTWGSQAFWKEKVKMIYGAVGLSPGNEPTALTV